MRYKSYSKPVLQNLFNLLETELRDIIQRVPLEKNQFLLEPGQRARYYYYLCEGLLVNYYLDKGREVVTTFTFPDDIIADFKSAIFKIPSDCYILSLAEGWAYRLSISDFDEYKARNPLILAAERELIAAYALLLEERLYFLQHKTAKERYCFLLENYPEFIHYIPLKYIASYLGITLETLSRLRSEL